MIEMALYEDIRRLHEKEGMSERGIARLLGISRNTVARYRDGANIPGQREPLQRESPVTGPIRDIVLGYLAEDQNAPPKQKHTAKRIYERLCQEHGFTGGDSTVRALVRELRGTGQVHIPLQFDPGAAGQVDWGSAYVYLDGVRTRVELFCMRLCNSGGIFVMAFPTQRYESFFEGHIQALEFFGGAPKTLIYDNLRTAVKEGWGKYVKEQQTPFKLLMAHYVISTRFCNPGKGNEKGLVENLVPLCRRNVMVPVPRVKDFEELNKLLRDYCQRYLDHKIDSRTGKVGELLLEEQKHMTPLPMRRFDPATVVTAKVNNSSLVRYDNSYYSVPAKYAGLEVTVKAYSLRIEVWCKNKQVAVHKRSYAQSHVTYEIEHYIPVLEKKSRAVRDAAPVKRTMDQRIQAYGAKLTDKDYVAVLKLSVDYGQEAVVRAVLEASLHGQYSFEAARLYLLQAKAPLLPVNAPIKVDPKLPTVKTVSLTPYDALLTGVASND